MEPVKMKQVLNAKQHVFEILKFQYCPIWQKGSYILDGSLQFFGIRIPYPPWNCIQAQNEQKKLNGLVVVDAFQEH